MNQTRKVESELFTELRKLTPKVTGGLLRMRQEAYRDGARGCPKYKLLTAMAISIAIRCEPCIRAYVQMACDKGITQRGIDRVPRSRHDHARLSGRGVVAESLCCLPGMP